nr:hypothetical protein [Kingella negevensis]
MVCELPTAANSRKTSFANSATSDFPNICGTERTANCPSPISTKLKP